MCGYFGSRTFLFLGKGDPNMELVSIIKYEGDNNTFIWKHPREDFNTLSQLVVHESQEAILFMDGQAMDSFGPGRYTLDTNNIPILGRFVKMVTGGVSPFHCEVYFINKSVQMALKWGTDSKIRYLDPNLGIPIEIGASGELNLAVSDAKKLLVKLVGTTNGIAWGDMGDGFTKSLRNAFRPMISTAVKTHLPLAIKSKAINILEIDEQMEALSGTVGPAVASGFEEYGLTVPQFYITNIVLPEEDPLFRKMKDLHTASFRTRMIRTETMVKSAEIEAEAELTAARRQIELERQLTETEIAKRQAERQLIQAQADAQSSKLTGFAEAEVMAAKGYNQQDVFRTEVQKAYAEGLGNMTISGGGSVAGDMIGLGVGMAAAGTVIPQMGEMFKGFAPTAPTPAAPAVSPEEKCANCGATLPANAKFCLECGEKVVPKLPDNMTLCPQCGNTVPKGKFCPECGHKFITVCPSCGKETVPGAKFCLECGQKL